jgi:hypothetical protein
MTARPWPSTAAQNAADGHETAERLPPGSVATGELQAWPVNVSAAPPAPTAAQNDADGHDTATGGWERLTVVGPDQPGGAAIADPDTTNATNTAAPMTNRYALISPPPDSLCPLASTATLALHVGQVNNLAPSLPGASRGEPEPEIGRGRCQRARAVGSAGAIRLGRDHASGCVIHLSRGQIGHIHQTQL